MAKKYARRRRNALLDFDKDFGGDLEKMIGQMDANFVLCRDLRHSWKNQDVKWDSQQKAYEQVLVCIRCTCRKIRLLSSSGEVLMRRSYDYPEHYLVKGVGHLEPADRDMVRLASVLAVTRG